VSGAHSGEQIMTNTIRKALIITVATAVLVGLGILGIGIMVND
jgi:hypothetical protein